ncbi:MAG: histidine--tRNA ligase [Candidatus Saccharibacteria bacterium]|nr:histidine--tRNA ligase [Candidatus Saccharibacteria bacterium]
MTLQTQPYKGSRDFYPEDKRLQKYIFKTMRSAVEIFGYEEYDAPILESLDLYKAKTGQEIVNEQTYAFVDRGGREVAIRPEMTPSVSRMVAARRQELSYPLRWYSLPNLWRYERPQRGRLREHWQLNVDIFGVAGLQAEHEIILVADQVMRAFGAKRHMYTIKLNSRRLMDMIFSEYLQVSQVQSQSLAKLIDRMHKMEHSEFVADLDALCTPSQRESGMSDRLMALLKTTTLEELPPEIQQHDACVTLTKLLKLLKSSEITNAVFDITVMRGFDYYTDVVFEVFDTHPDNNRSMFGGGRYDGLVGLFGVDPVPTVGFGMGDVTLANFLDVHGLMPNLKVESDMYVVLVGDVYDKAQKLLAELRQMGLKLAVDCSGKKPGDQIKTAVKKGISYVLIVGDRELAEDHYTIKNLVSGEEEHHSLQRIVSIVKDYRKK